MILICPACDTRYHVDRDAFAHRSRRVRCAACGHVWKAADPESDAAAKPPAPIDPAPPLEDVAAQAAAAELEGGPSLAEVLDSTPDPAPPSPTRRRTRFWPAAGWAAAAGVIVALLVGGVSRRSDVVAVWPQSASLYAAVGLRARAGGLDITAPQAERLVLDADGAAPVLRVTATVENITGRARPVPTMAVTLRDADGREVARYLARTEAADLPPRASAAFAVDLPDPPADAADVRLTFAEAGAAEEAGEEGVLVARLEGEGGASAGTDDERHEQPGADDDAQTRDAHADG